MAEEEQIEDNSIEEEKVEDEPEIEANSTEEEEESAPIEYTKKLGVEEKEEEEESSFTRFIDNCIEYLDGRSNNLCFYFVKLFYNFKIPSSRGDIVKVRLNDKVIYLTDESYNSNPLSLNFSIKNSKIKLVKPNIKKGFLPNNFKKLSSSS